MLRQMAVWVVETGEEYMRLSKEAYLYPSDVFLPSS